MSKYIDYQCTIWKRLYFNNIAPIEEIIEKLEDGYTPDEFCSDEWGFNRSEFLYETEELAHIKETNGLSTIMVHNDDELLWYNEEENNY